MTAEVGKRYVHYKNGKEYIVLSMGIHTETNEKMVVYQGQYDDPEFGHNPIWIRPRKMFEEKINYQGREVDRFSAC